MSALEGQHALVTGANRGIGAAIAIALSSRGARVTLLVRDRGSAQVVMHSLGGPHAVVIANVADRDAVRLACAGAVDQLGPIDILVNNAGSTESAPFLKTEPELFERMFAVHVLGAVHATQAVLPGMIERGRGHLVNVASTAGLRGEAYVSAYVAAKHALVGLTRSLAVELRRHGVRVNAVCPGYTDTTLVRDAVARIASRTGLGEEQALQTILASANQARLVTVDEVAAAVLALCEDGRSTGEEIVVEGNG